MNKKKFQEEPFPTCPMCGKMEPREYPGGIVLCLDSSCAFGAEPRHWISLHRKTRNARGLALFIKRPFAGDENDLKDYGQDVAVCWFVLKHVKERYREIEADARLGKLVRKLKHGRSLGNLTSEWDVRDEDDDEIGCGLTPEEALERAGVK